jgi:hypothetical protein
MGEDDARALIERVVREADRGAVAELEIRRGLMRRSDGDWDFTATVSLDGNIEHSRLPLNLGASLTGKLRARIRPAGGLLALVSGDLAVMET